MGLNIRWDLVTGAAIGIGTAVMGGWDTALKVLLILMAADILTGLLKALKSGVYTSKEFRQGLVSKAGFFIVIILCYQLDLIINNGTPMIRDVAIVFYIAIEGSSILENLGQMGVPIPNVVKNKLAVLKDMNNKQVDAAVKDVTKKLEDVAAKEVSTTAEDAAEDKKAE